MGKEKMQKIYGEALEDWPMAMEDITTPYKKMRTEFEGYINAIQESAFFLWL